MKKTNVNIENMNEVLPAILASNAEKAVKQSREHADVVGLDYNAKAIKIKIDGKLQQKVSAYYAIKMHLVSVSEQYLHNIKVVQGRIDEYAKKQELSESDVESMNSAMKDLAKYQACYKFFKGKVTKELKEVFKDIPSELHDAYTHKFTDENGYKQALSSWLKSVDSELTDSFFDFVNKAIGLKSAGLRRRVDNIHVEVQGKNAFTSLLMDLILTLALDKQVMSKKVIEQTLATDCVEIAEFTDIVTVERPTYKTTVKEYKAIFDKVGVIYPANMKKDKCMEIYAKALRDGAFAEIA